MEALKRLGFDTPDETEIGVDLGYSTTIFEAPKAMQAGWRGMATSAAPAGG